MMIETATVVGYRNGVATVQCQAKSACGGCSAKSACGTTSLSALAGEKIAPRFELSVPEPLAIGSQIQIGLAEQTLLHSVFWIYCVPLMVLILSAVGFSHFFTNELAVAGFIFISVGLTFFIIKKIIAKKQISEFTPVFVARIN